jgi:hypothetical protein
MSTTSDKESKEVGQNPPQATAEELTREELETVSGGKPVQNQTCTATGDTGMMGCPG